MKTMMRDDDRAQSKRGTGIRCEVRKFRRTARRKMHTVDENESKQMRTMLQ